ncbi:MAG TPA: hypothetical protein VFK13_16000 [Gemmatimonadaceae bacterium]|nr:hypothetical protein [Gemmatimonadaceae bacterium]
MQIASTSRTLVVAAALVLVAACTRRVQTESLAARADATLRVDNQSLFDMDVFAVQASQRIRLGLVPASSRRSLTIPANVVGHGRRLQFLADPVGSSSQPISQELYVEPGDEVGLLIPASQVR